MSFSARGIMVVLGLAGWAVGAAEPVSAPADQRPAFIQIKCEPGVRILVDGKDSGTSSREQGGLVIQGVAPGTYVIQARKEGFRPQELRTVVRAGTVQLLYVTPFQERAAAGTASALALGQRTGGLVVRTVPVDCRLRLPGLHVDSEKSAAEWRGEAVPVGTYEIEVLALGQTLKQAVTVEADRTAEVLFNFLRGEVQVLTAQPAPAAPMALPSTAPTEAQVKATEERLAAAERDLAAVRTALQTTREGADLSQVRKMMERRDALGRLQRDLTYELGILRQRARNEAESARREAGLLRRKAFDVEYADYGHLARDPDVPPEVKLKAWAALCARWSVDPGTGSGRLLWDDSKAVPYRVVSRVVPLEDDVELELVEIVAGSFALGSEDGDDDEKPVRTVAISRPFWIGKHEVTQAQYRAVTGASPSHFRGENRPVETVTWQDAEAFCKRLTERERKAKRLPAGLAFRLPTEAEWEYACRAGTTTPFSFGERLDATQANYDVSQGAGRNRLEPARETLPVGSFTANPWDLHDMHGNVWEWCADWYDREFYARLTQLDPFNVRPSPSVVCRGGSWVNPLSFCRSSNRNNGDARQANHMTGFRVVLAAPLGQ